MTTNHPQAPDRWLRDPSLTWRAKGLLAYIANHDQPTSAEQMIAASKDDADSTRSGLAELIAAGYVQRHQPRRDNGKLGPVTYSVTAPDNANEN